MRNKIKQILKEEKDYYDSVYLIMSEDEKSIKYNLHVALQYFQGDAYFDGGPDRDGWETSDVLDNKTFRNFYFNTLQSTNGLISLMPQRILDKYKPKVVEFTMGFFRKRDNVSDVFDQLKESEESEFDWVEGPSNEPFHNILMKGERRRPRLMDEIKTIMFNPPVEIGSQRFNKIAYWLEDRDYYPEELKLEGRTSYIEIIKQRGSNNIRNGRWRLGPELSNQELYELSQTTKNGWNYNFWEDEFIARFYDKEMPD